MGSCDITNNQSSFQTVNRLLLRGPASVFLIIIVVGSHAQFHPDSLLMDYDQLIGNHRGLINGYTYYPYQLNGANPYLDDAQWRSGTVIVNHNKFSNVAMLLDLESNQLVIRQTAGGTARASSLIKEQVQSFSINDKLFKPVVLNDQLTFLEVLYEGKTWKLYKSHSKKKQISPTTKKVEFAYFTKTMIAYDGAIQALPRSGKFYKLYPTYKEDVKAILEEHPDFSLRNPSDLVQVLSLIERQGI